MWSTDSTTTGERGQAGEDEASAPTPSGQRREQPIEPLESAARDSAEPPPADVASDTRGITRDPAARAGTGPAKLRRKTRAGAQVEARGEHQSDRQSDPQSDDKADDQA